jgi:hypothetical protein
VNVEKKIFMIFVVALLLTICSCTSTDESVEADIVNLAEEESSLNSEEVIIHDETEALDDELSGEDLSDGTGKDIVDLSEAETDTDFFHYSMDTIEQTLTQDAYLRQVYSAYWIANQGDNIVPLLDDLLDKHAGNELFYSFGVYWALGQIGSSKAEQLLLNHENDDYAILALKALRARKKAYNPDNIGVIYDSSKMYAEPRMDSKIVGTVEMGDIVFYLESYIENENEPGPRGGYVVYDYFEIANTGLKGYVIRRADDFSPTM